MCVQRVVHSDAVCATFALCLRLKLPAKSRTAPFGTDTLACDEVFLDHFVLKRCTLKVCTSGKREPFDTDSLSRYTAMRFLR